MIGQLYNHLDLEYSLFEFEEVDNSVRNKRIEFLITNTTPDSFKLFFNQSAKGYKYGELINLNGYKMKINRSEASKQISETAWQSFSTFQYKVVCSKLILLHGQEYKQAEQLLIKHKYKEAEETFTKLISIGLKWSEIYYSRAMARSELNNFPAALKYLNRTLKLNPNLKIAYEKRANIKRSLGKTKGADQDEEKYKSINNRLENKTK
jgi:tetratricopeptide (TPR) repeat protein